jgi:hypothetical protein
MYHDSVIIHSFVCCLLILLKVVSEAESDSLKVVVRRKNSACALFQVWSLMLLVS